MALTVLAMIAALAAADPTPDACAVDRAAMLKLTPEGFDQDMKGGWRPLAHRSGCEVAAAELIAAYRQAHWGALKQGELHSSYWHEGQVWAMAGRNDEAVPLLMAGVNPCCDGGFAEYALGTIAFLDHDLAALKAARARLAQLPEPDGFDREIARYKAETGVTLRWPMNLDVLDELITCFDKPYRDAYGGEACRPK